ncbi:MAG: NAD-binding protein [Akkermansiaceae bacterium]|nr:NAD-binding protein [Akkermansiaceae bacterium]
MNDRRIAIVGVGRMGANMARRLKDCGHTVSVVYDVRREAAEQLAVELGCRVADSLAAVTSAAEVVLTVVTDDVAMRELFLTPGDSLLERAEGKLFLNCATLSPAVQVAVAEAGVAAGAMVVEACMASSITQAREGTLYLMLGGTAEAVAAAGWILEDLAQARRHVGNPGQAAKVKALVNMVMNSNTAALAEGLGLGTALGLDPTLLLEIFSQTGANSRVLATDGADMVDREHECYFSAAHAAKDSGIANAMAAAAGVAVPLSLATEAQYLRLCQLGLGELDKSGIAELTFAGRAPA